MKTIKFRVFDKDLKRMRTVRHLYLNTGPIEVLVQDGKQSSIKLIESEFYLMQYTGLLDKNGKEIYEGDVIQWKTHEDNGYKIHEIQQNCEVRFDGGNYKFGASEDSWWHDLRGSEKEVNIIGNIYENLDLLK